MYKYPYSNQIKNNEYKEYNEYNFIHVRVLYYVWVLNQSNYIKIDLNSFLNSHPNTSVCTFTETKLSPIL